MSDDEDEDGQISKFEQEEEREQRLAGKTKSEEEPITNEELKKCQLTREKLCHYSKHPWFEDYVKGAFYVCEPPLRPCLYESARHLFTRHK